MWRLSTGLRNALLEYNAHVTNMITDTSISFGVGDGTNGRDTINDASSNLAGFIKNDNLTISGTANNDGVYRTITVSPSIIEVPAGSFTAETAGPKVSIAAAVGGSYASVLRNGIIRIFSGTQPSSADDGETGTLLCEITLGSGSFTPGLPDNGINLGNVANGIIHKATDQLTGNPEVWSGVGTAACGSNGLNAGWFRFYANDVAEGASASAVRIDGAVSTSGAQLNMSSTLIVEGVTVTIDTVDMPLPESP
jgi:hypothetical protein